MNTENRIKVLHVYRTYFPDPPGGLQEAIKQICLSVENFGVESKIFTLSPEPNPRSIKLEEGEVIREKSIINIASCDIGGFRSFQKFRELVEWCDIVQLHFPWPFADILNFLIPKGKPTLMTYHSDIVRQKFLGKLYNPLMNRTLRSVDCIVATSQNYVDSSPVLSREEFRSKTKVAPLCLKDRVITEGGSGKHEVLAKYGLEENNYVLALGVLRYYKGFHTLIEAAKYLNTTIVIAGSGPESETLRLQVEKLKLSNVVFTGQVEEDEKHVLIQNSILLTLPSHLRSEAFGVVLIEALMHSKPLVTCDIGTGTSFVNKHQETGLVVEPENPKALAQAINSIVSDMDMLCEYQSSARKRYENFFSSQAVSQQYMNIYHSILKT
ncbi:glycosyltransferase [Enterovibrio sp. ZSDZ35]|uniref:Glycosyltransferase n=1 Tax=Enterovibrio qingdaonensis TaxID=2899818 RepID=A0ABT5QND8_9GAMM|nr:glycosyltransferase [Enterovibrio sp. ZSDZ35]MDD1782477.1 glycosyltransferase [Enterovibrio sp. ZSDZ35]